jgi:tRNA modification GTPase
MFGDTIAAISTAPGEAGIAIIRVSGDNSIKIVQNIFKPYREEASLMTKSGYTLTLGWITDEDQEKLDQVLVGLMKAPYSYTAEDVVEINCHGGELVAKRILMRVIKAGARPAQPGEFTKRAFLNGRIDVSQAEAIIDLIRAKSDKALKMAVKQLEGQTSRLIYEIEEKMVQVMTLVEATIDFSDDIGGLDLTQVKRILQDQLINIDKLLKAAARAELYRRGIKLVICGKPNVGKSSLLNLITNRERSIVTDIPGTTRDIIEEHITIRGIPVRIIDTAGIRYTDDPVETIGVEKAKQALNEADIALFLLDVGSGISEEDLIIYNHLHGQKVIVFVNKEDLEEKKLTGQQLGEFFPGVPVIKGSVSADTGIADLEDAIEKMVSDGSVAIDDIETMINIRQKEALQRAELQLLDTLEQLDIIPLDCLSVDIGVVLEALGDITGKNLYETAIDQIFEEFCIGK